MILYSTNNKAHQVDLATATLKGLAPDKGLYMPLEIPALPSIFWENIESLDFQDIAFEISKTLIQGAITDSDLKGIVERAINFDAPVIPLDEHYSVLELFHGPSLAFKDFGARFMSEMMSYFNKENSSPLTILVATSGDTGGAVAAGFFDTPGIEVIILFPKGKVSPLQELQLTTWGGNIQAVEIDSVFDDCQDLVKKAFLDPDLKEKYRLSSANSINICRLIPQSFYYAEAYKQAKKLGKPIKFVVPSGNFGNLTAGYIAYKMGMPIEGFVAATNANDVVTRYVKTGKYEPRTTVPTISNAMDVGNPSNFIRLETLVGSTWNNFNKDVNSYSFSDGSTREGMKEVLDSFGYIMDPHGAVGYLAAKKDRQAHSDVHYIILETAHPSKFLKEVERTLGKEIEVPERLSVLKEKNALKESCSKNYGDFKEFLLKR